MLSTALSTKEGMDQSAVAPAASRKFLSTVLPWGVWATSSYTLDGPPESTRAVKPPPSTRSTGSVHGRISEYTPSSRMRRAMSWVYWPPKSRIATLLATPVLPRGPQLLGALEDLPLGLDRGREDQLGLLQLLDVHDAHRGHAGADGALEVEGPGFGARRVRGDVLDRSVTD